MKVTYFELVGQGTLLHPTYKALKVVRTEYCDTIMKAGNLWYMIRGGYVWHSIEVENITKIEFDGCEVICKHYNEGTHPFTCRFRNKFGKEFGGGYADFAGLFKDVKTYGKNGF